MKDCNTLTLQDTSCKRPKGNNCLVLASDSCPAKAFSFPALHINTVSLLIHLQQVPKVLNVNKCRTNLHDLQEFPFCVTGACDSDVCGDVKGPSSHSYANRLFLERRNKEFKCIPIGRSTVARSLRPLVTLTMFRAGQMKAICGPASI